MEFYNKLQKYPPFLAHEHFINTLSDEQLNEISTQYFDYFYENELDCYWHEHIEKTFDFYYSLEFSCFKKQINELAFCDFWTEETAKQFLLFIMQKQNTKMLRKLFVDVMHNYFCGDLNNKSVYAGFCDYIIRNVKNITENCVNMQMYPPYNDFVTNHKIRRFRLMWLTEKVYESYQNDSVIERVFADEFIASKIAIFL